MTLVVFSGGLAHAQVQIPPKYEIVQITETAYLEGSPRINNRGQVVFTTTFDVSDLATQEIFLYDDGELIRLTDDAVRDVSADINDDGTIVWCRGIGPPDDVTGKPTTEIMLRRDGETVRLTDNDQYDFAPAINSLGQVVWKQYVGQGPCGRTMDIFFYDGETVHRLTTDGETEDLANQGADLNDHGEIVWTRYDFCVNPWQSDIMLYRDDAITQISSDDVFAPQHPSINNAGQVAWTFDHNDGTGHNGIELWENGVITLFTDWGSSPCLNDHGDMLLDRWHPDVELWQVWLYRNGSFCQLSDDPFWNANGDMNDIAEAAWGSGDYPWRDIRSLRLALSGRPAFDYPAGAIDVRRMPP
jgi:hypothetical protein